MVSRRPQHLLVALSGHGYGHAAQAAPAINALRAILPSLQVTLYSKVARAFLTSRFEGPLDIVSRAPDLGLPMDSPLDVRVDETMAAYQSFHKDWERRVWEQEKLLDELHPDLILADVPYCLLPAARNLDIPAVALCSLNWADIFESYCGHLPDATSIISQIRESYGKATLFIRPEPSMPMSWLETKSVSPIARPTHPCREELRAALGARPDQLVVLVALGGIPWKLAFEAWPRRGGDNIIWLVPAEAESKGHRRRGKGRRKTFGVIAISDTPKLQEMHFVDLQASCDCLVAKPGYNTFVEAGLGDIPVVFVRRGDWPEEPVLVEWLSERARSVEISREQLDLGQLVDEIHAVVSLPPRRNEGNGKDEGKEKPSEGAAEAAEILAGFL